MAVESEPPECTICGLDIKYDTDMNTLVIKNQNWIMCDVCRKRINKVFMFLDNELGLAIKYSWKYQPDE